jgi:hypothetical protein
VKYNVTAFDPANRPLESYTDIYSLIHAEKTAKDLSMLYGLTCEVIIRNEAHAVIQKWVRGRKQ